MLMLAAVFLSATVVIPAEEGMFPLSEIHKLALRDAGLQISPQQIYNPRGVSLIDAICIVGGGCTGSFISPRGLILTNYHCARRAIQSASNTDNDYLKEGFFAGKGGNEIIAKGYTIRITESYRDVSRQVLGVVKKKMNYRERTKAIEKKIKKIVKKAEKQHPGKRARVSEMFLGKTYVLFIYTFIRDVRLVYAPPMSIGNYGGDIDNWEWPRHTGDFTLLRAYVAKDGSSAEYSVNNVPYKPRNYLRVAREGIGENDFVFILGYPGRTYRHRTSYFLEYQEKTLMPQRIEFYDWMIDLMVKQGEENRAIAIKHLSTMRGLANVSKNYKGKIQGMRRKSIVLNRRNQEQKMQQFIEADPELKSKYGKILKDIARIYDKKTKQADHDFILSMLGRVRLFNAASFIYKSALERTKKDIERESPFMDRNYERSKDRILRGIRDYYELTDKMILGELFKRARALPKGQKIGALDRIYLNSEDPEKSIARYIDDLYSGTKLGDPPTLKKYLNLSPGAQKKLKDPYLDFYGRLYPLFKKSRDENFAEKGELDNLSAKLIEIKRKFIRKEFVPDANGTLRLTYGYVKGYSPNDAVYCKPFTTLKGILEKYTGKDPFIAPREILALIQSRDYGSFIYPKYGTVPVCLLYNMDTTGGNSGSPVLDARGYLVGLNFDRTFQATINDYAWNKDLSRSIGVDIRYILWLLQKYAGADYLLNELQVTR